MWVPLQGRKAKQQQTAAAHELAWGYDLVITTFTQLSAGWARRKDSPLLKVGKWDAPPRCRLI